MLSIIDSWPIFYRMGVLCDNISRNQLIIVLIDHNFVLGFIDKYLSNSNGHTIFSLRLWICYTVNKFNNQASPFFINLKTLYLGFSSLSSLTPSVGRRSRSSRPLHIFLTINFHRTFKRGLLFSFCHWIQLLIHSCILLQLQSIGSKCFLGERCRNVVTRISKLRSRIQVKRWVE